MLVMAIVFCAGTFGLNFQMTTALMATDVYGKGAGEYGAFGSILALGSLAGSLVAARRPASRQRVVVIAACIFGLVEITAGLMPSYLLFAAMLPLCGFAALTMVTAANTFVQMTAAPHMRGRVMALYMMIFMGGTPIGAPVLGWISERFGARWTLIGGGALTTAGTLVAALTIGRLQGVRIAADWDNGPRLKLTLSESGIAADTIH
jgi:MFS family permease